MLGVVVDETHCVIIGWDVIVGWLYWAYFVYHLQAFLISWHQNYVKCEYSNFWVNALLYVHSLCYQNLKNTNQIMFCYHEHLSQHLYMSYIYIYTVYIVLFCFLCRLHVALVVLHIYIYILLTYIRYTEQDRNYVSGEVLFLFSPLDRSVYILRRMRTFSRWARSACKGPR